jgi:uncharacterized RDD family membrane protein YckC
MTAFEEDGVLKITCSYCHAANEEDDHRCRRCGRRLLATASENAAAPYSSAATAPVLRPVPAPSREIPADPVARPETPAVDAPRRVTFQRSLFSPRETPQVVSLDSIVLPPEERTRTRTERPKPRARRPIPGQQALEFVEPERRVETEVEAVIYCDAPVALPSHRMMAVAVDVSLILIALGIFVSVFVGTLHWMDVQVPPTRQALPLLGGIGVVFALLYKVIWCLGDNDSPGMRWTHQRLINFDGQLPDREQRLRRLASACLSLMAAGLGIVWALVDEESLTWHDHISRTFPTPY